MLTARIAGCVFSVSASWSSGPSKQRRLSGSPSAASASANVSRQTGKAPASALPMPTFCEPCPGKMNAINGLCPRDARRCGGGDLTLDALEKALRGELVGHRDGVADGLGARPAVADDGDTCDPE